MRAAIVAYPTLADRDRVWIESIRQAHDPQAARIAAHFTLVFPVDASPDQLTPEMSAAAAVLAPIPFTIRGTEVVRDVFSGDDQLFLVPDEGAHQITALHDRLYAGGLRAFLRSDIAYVPHMTIASAKDRGSCERLVDALGLRSLTLSGTLESIALVDLSEAPVRVVASFHLGEM
jgi:2'-5' RNA ligase